MNNLLLDVYVDVERSEGKNVGKDYLAEELSASLLGMTAGIVFAEEVDERTQDQYDLTEVEYLGTAKGKPLHFLVTVEQDPQLPQAEDIEQALESAIAEVFEDEGGINYEDSYYDINEVTAVFSAYQTI